MRPVLALQSLALLATMAQAVGTMKSVLVSFSDNTDDAVVKKAKQDIINAGGKITHEYSIFKGFAAEAPAQVLEVSIAATGATIEEDQNVTTQEN